MPTDITPGSFLVKTKDGYLGASSTGRMSADNPRLFAYTFETPEDADEAARRHGRQAFTIVPARN